MLYIEQQYFANGPIPNEFKDKKISKNYYPVLIISDSENEKDLYGFLYPWQDEDLIVDNIDLVDNDEISDYIHNNLSISYYPVIEDIDGQNIYGFFYPWEYQTNEIDDYNNNDEDQLMI